MTTPTNPTTSTAVVRPAPGVVLRGAAVKARYSDGSVEVTDSTGTGIEHLDGSMTTRYPDEPEGDES
jgi:hypothetical protein